MSSALHRRWRTAAIFLVHAALTAAGYFAAYLLRYDFNIPPGYLKAFAWTLPILIVVRAGAFAAFGLHRRFWRFAGVSDLIALTLLLLPGPRAAAESGVRRSPHGTLIEGEFRRTR